MSNASAALPPWAVGLVSGSMIFSCSMIEPGHPCVTMSGSAFSMLRTHVNEMNVQPVDLGDELRQGVQPRLDLAPVVVRPPIARELLHRRELHALRFIVHRLAFGPLCRVDAPAEIDELLLRNIDTEGTDRVAFGRRRTLWKQTKGPCGRDTHGSGSDKTAAITVDVFGCFFCFH